MNSDLVYLPVLAHIALVLFLFIRLGSEKSKAFKLGLVDPKVTALNPKAWPDAVVKISNNIDNQFETPMLFYALVFIYVLCDLLSPLVLGLMLFYVATRYLHAYVHTTSNYVPNRYKIFVLGMFTLLVLLVILVGQILLGA